MAKNKYTIQIEVHADYSARHGSKIFFWNKDPAREGYLNTAKVLDAQEGFKIIAIDTRE